MKERMLARKNGPMVKSPRMLPAIASPHAFRLTATMPPASANTERIHPIAPHITRIDWSVSTEIGESAGSTF